MTLLNARFAINSYSNSLSFCVPSTVNPYRNRPYGLSFSIIGARASKVEKATRTAKKVPSYYGLDTPSWYECKLEVTSETDNVSVTVNDKPFMKFGAQDLLWHFACREDNPEYEGPQSYGFSTVKQATSLDDVYNTEQMLTGAMRILTGERLDTSWASSSQVMGAAAILAAKTEHALAIDIHVMKGMLTYSNSPIILEQYIAENDIPDDVLPDAFEFIKHKSNEAKMDAMQVIYQLAPKDPTERHNWFCFMHGYINAWHYQKPYDSIDSIVLKYLPQSHADTAKSMATHYHNSFNALTIKPLRISDDASFDEAVQGIVAKIDNQPVLNKYLMSLSTERGSDITLSMLETALDSYTLMVGEPSTVKFEIPKPMFIKGWDTNIGYATKSMLESIVDDFDEGIKRILSYTGGYYATEATKAIELLPSLLNQPSEETLFMVKSLAILAKHIQGNHSNYWTNIAINVLLSLKRRDGMTITDATSIYHKMSREWWLAIAAGIEECLTGETGELDYKTGNYQIWLTNAFDFLKSIMAGKPAIEFHMTKIRMIALVKRVCAIAKKMGIDMDVSKWITVAISNSNSGDG